MRQLGVGLVYWSALAPLFESGEAEVLELEPQTLWTKQPGPAGPRYALNEALFDAIAQLPQAKLLHGVGQPFGGTVCDPVQHARLLRRMADRLDARWVSEHLSFNRIRRDGAAIECGFLLPPPQTPAAVRVAAANIRRYGQALGRPVAFETGVNYFRRASSQMHDGDYFGAVAGQADSGIVLDLHNLWCNERNGGLPVFDVIDRLPLDRVWEVHVAGGMPLDGYWLDAHSHAMPARLVDIAAEVIARLPNLGALMFEILPEHLPNLGLDGVRRQLAQLRSLWAMRPGRSVSVSPRGQASTEPPSADDIVAVRAWETALASALRGDTAAAVGDATAMLAEDPACALMRTLITDFRSANLTRGLRFTITLLLAALGVDATTQLLQHYFRATPPDAFAAIESHGFTRFLAEQRDLLAGVPYLAEVFAFEKALLDASLFGGCTELAWTTDPTRLLEVLEAGQLPHDLPPAPSRMTIVA